MANLKDGIVITVKNVWIISKNGVCLLQSNFEFENGSKIDKDIIGGITSSVINLIPRIGTKETEINSITLEHKKLHYYYDHTLIICLETHKIVDERVIRKVLTKIHSNFLKKYSQILTSRIIINSDKFYYFKKEILKIFDSNNLLPYFRSLKLSKTFLRRMEELLMII
jgi:hypothetical protein